MTLIDKDAALAVAQSCPDSHWGPWIAERLRALPAAVPGVKPLTFEGRNGFWRADDGIGGFYQVTEVYGAFHMCRIVVGVANRLIPYNSQDAAFAAANLEHHRRILSALAPQPAPEPRDVREAAQILRDMLNYLEGEAPGVTSGGQRNSELRDRILALIPGVKPTRSANRVTYDDKCNLDEIVTDAGVHLEDLGGDRWFLGAARSDGTEIRVWFKGKVTMIEDDAKGDSE